MIESYISCYPTKDGRFRVEVDMPWQHKEAICRNCSNHKEQYQYAHELADELGLEIKGL